MKLDKSKWVWMPHPGHLIVSSDCRFSLNTYVGGYIVSTVGEWWPARVSREIHASVYDPEWLAENKHLKGDYFDRAYMKKFGYEDIGAGRTYETMVFKAEKETHDEFKCCPWKMSDPMNIDSDGYNDPVSAYKGHLKFCKRYGAKV